MASLKPSKSRSKSTKSKASKSSKSKTRYAKPRSSKSSKRKKSSFAHVPPTIGFLVAATTAGWQPYTEAFEEGLLTYGWVKGTDYNIDYEPPGGAAGDLKAIQDAAKQFVKSGVDLIVTAGTEAAKACRDATAIVPIVFASVGDPVDSGLVAKLSTPGGNLTGCSNMQTNLNVLAKRIDVMRTKHRPAVVGVIGNQKVEPVGAVMKQASGILNNLPNVKAYLGDIPDKASIQTVIDNLYTAYKVDTLFVCSDPLLSACAEEIDNATASSATGKRPQKIKAMYEFREYVDRHPNATQCYGPNFARLFGQAAWYVYQILNNKVSPGDLAVYLPSPSSYDLVPP